MEKDIWKEQFERMRRYASRVRNLISTVKFDRPADCFVDDVHAFFIECHSFKDWLINDPSFTEYTKREIEKFVSSKLELSLCADVANGKKHLVCHNRRNKNDPKFQLRYGIEVLLWPDGDAAEQVIVSSKQMDFTISPNTNGLDATRAEWIAQGFDEDNIKFLMFVDIESEGGTQLDYNDGIAGFADDVIDIWAEFIKQRRSDFNPCTRWL